MTVMKPRMVQKKKVPAATIIHGMENIMAQSVQLKHYGEKLNSILNLWSKLNGMSIPNLIPLLYHYRGKIFSIILTNSFMNSKLLEKKWNM